MIGSVKYIVCPECKGEGEIKVIDENGEQNTNTCPLCGGDCKILNEEDFTGEEN